MRRMTCIVGIEAKGGVILGADSISTDYAVTTVRSAEDCKVFRIGEYVLGFTSSFRMGNLLRYHLALPPPPARGSLHRHLVLKVVPAVRACLKEGGFATTKEGAEQGGSFLLGVRGELWSADADYQMGRNQHGYAAIGCGYAVALGSLYSSKKLPPRRRVTLALEAAEQHSVHVRRPWRLLAERAG